jgi:hypothetical protein
MTVTIITENVIAHRRLDETGESAVRGAAVGVIET